MNARSCLWPCPPSSPHLLQPPCPRAQCTRLGQQVLCLSAGSPQAGCLSQPWWGARQCPAGCTQRWMASCPAGSCSSPCEEHGPCWGTQSWGHTLGHQGCLPLLLRPCGTGWPHTQPWCPSLPNTPGPHTPQSQFLSAHPWHAARPTGNQTTRHWNEHNLSFNWG